MRVGGVWGFGPAGPPARDGLCGVVFGFGAGAFDRVGCDDLQVADASGEVLDPGSEVCRFLNIEHPSCR
ncbi:hypothetical protein AYX19_00990 [Paenarthrobacter ureafaciens]|nr:hypothetical protein AYX19_00990 [Paenarthrobacter ureafaciens]